MVNKINRLQKKRDGYLENNCELAKENGQLRQQLNQFQNEYAIQSERILELKTQINDLIAIKDKYNSIVKIVLDIGDEVTSIRALPSCSISPSFHSATGSEATPPEKSKAPEQHDTSAGSSNRTDLNRITERSEEDSLQPRECTSVAPFRSELNDQTPSVWKALDDVEIEKPAQDRLQQETQLQMQPKSPPFSVVETCVRNESMSSTSPIRLIDTRRMRESNPIFHSTPVRSKDGKNHGNNYENQENIHKLSNINCPPEVQKSGEHPAKGKGRARKRPQPQPAKNDDAPRYNLRKRAKQQVA